MSEYLLCIKALVDSLASIGNPVSVKEQIDTILECLTEEYIPFTVSVNTKLQPYSVSEMEALLMSHNVIREKFGKLLVQLIKLL